MADKIENDNRSKHQNAEENESYVVHGSSNCLGDDIRDDPWLDQSL